MYKHSKVTKDVKWIDSPHLIRGQVAHDAIDAHIKHGTALTDAAVPESTKVAKIVAHFKKKGGTLLSENQVTIRKDGSLTQWRDWSGAWFRFGLDLLWRRPDDRASHVVDWKTGKSAYMDEFQLQSYGVAELYDNPKVEMVKADYVFLDEGAIRKGDVVMDRTGIEILRDELFEECHSIESAVLRDDLPYKKNRFCDWCDAKQQGVCEEWK
jgi:hypothetical protein